MVKLDLSKFKEVSPEVYFLGKKSFNRQFSKKVFRVRTKFNKDLLESSYHFDDNWRLVYVDSRNKSLFKFNIETDHYQYVVSRMNVLLFRADCLHKLECLSDTPQLEGKVYMSEVIVK